ncbi:MAG: TonB family protein [Caulobacterales bacterium]|nr:TonB family protein [Caulobacterales bacterium]
MAAPSAGWVSRPTQAEAAAVRPAGDALARAILRCHVEDDGALSGCSVAAESPPGRGVGAAAMMLAPKYSQAPPGRSGARDIKLSIVWSNIDKGADWLRKPTAQDLLTVYPKTAHGRAGLAVIDCIVTVQGGLSDCVVESEKPEGAGFGEAAIRLSAQFLMRPATLKGAPAPSEARIPITWEAFSESSWTPGRSVAPANLPWAEAPTIAEVAAAYPAKARAEEKVGRVTLSCDMDENGRLAHCESVNAQPSGYGFEAAAKTLAKRFRYTVASDADRKAAHGVAVMMPFTFDPAARDPASAVLGKPTWAAIPSSAQLTAAFAPLKLTATGRATLSCVVQPGGSLSDCSVLSEQPTGIGVGAAALSLTPTFRVSTWSTEGLPVVGGRISIPLRYEPAPAEPAAEK